MNNLIMELRIDSARAYVLHKGRLPKDTQELYEWLKEFAEFETKRCELVERAFREHINTCVRPALIWKEIK